MLRVVDRVLCAANMKIMMSRQNTISAESVHEAVEPIAASINSRKRKAEPEVAQPIISTPLDNSPEALLARAMSDTFDC